MRPSGPVSTAPTPTVTGHRHGPGGALRLSGASVRRGGRVIWSDVDLCIEPGDFVAVLGPNGAGKSTLLDVILGLLPLSAGHASVLGGPPGRLNSAIGYLPQRRQLDQAAPIRGRDIVRLGLDGTRWGIPLPASISSRAAEAAHRTDEVIDLVGAGGYADRPFGQLSGGEQQRLLIAQALARRPRMLLLDEPLDSLDLSNQGAVAALVQRICRTEGVTVLLVAHDVNPILGYLDRVVYFARGRGVEGTPREVITGPTLSELYSAPIEVVETSDGRLVVVGTPEPPAVHASRHVH